MSSTMRSNSSPSTSTPTIADPSGFKHLNSPIPYLFGGLALMLVLIAMALIILAWSYRKHGDDGDEESKVAAKKVEEVEEDHEPKIVVIMPGNHNPTYLAKPKPKPVPINIVHGDEQV